MATGRTPPPPGAAWLDRARIAWVMAERENTPESWRKAAGFIRAANVAADPELERFAAEADAKAWEIENCISR